MSGYAPADLDPTVWAFITIGLAMNWLPLARLDGARLALSRVRPAVQAAILALGIWTLFAAAQDGVAPFINFQF